MVAIQNQDEYQSRNEESFEQLDKKKSSLSKSRSGQHTSEKRNLKRIHSMQKAVHHRTSKCTNNKTVTTRVQNEKGNKKSFSWHQRATQLSHKSADKHSFSARKVQKAFSIKITSNPRCFPLATRGTVTRCTKPISFQHTHSQHGSRRRHVLRVNV